MATHRFEAIRLTDAHTFEAFTAIAAAMGWADGKVHVRLSDQHSVDHDLTTLASNRTIIELLKANTAAASSISLNFQRANASIEVDRQHSVVKIEVHAPHNFDATQFARFTREAHQHLKGVDSSDSIRGLFGDQLAEFYSRREETLVRLEQLNHKLIEQNEAYRRQLDHDREESEKALAEEAKRSAAALEATYAEKNADLSKREQALAERAGALDDRNSRHVRRQIRQDLKSALNSRAERFTLTKSTTQKRYLVHALFVALLGGSASLIVHALWNGPPDGNGATFWFHLARVLMGIAGFAASMLFYIRWNDRWFRQHADEEFRLKQLELDIDRASWVVEMAMEWKDEKGFTIPDELIERLTRSLFTDRERTEKLQHPYEDLASALFDSVKSMRMTIPGIGDAELDRRSLRRFRKAAAAHTEPDGE